MLSQTGLYALQAVLHLAIHRNGSQVPAAVLARELQIPGTYLAKVLQRLAREGILESTRGARGGYRLLGDPAELTVGVVVAPFQEMKAPQRCLMGGPCDPQNPCNAHGRRAAWNAAAGQMLEQTTLADLVSGAPLALRNPVADTEPEDSR